VIASDTASLAFVEAFFACDHIDPIAVAQSVAVQASSQPG
jgi:hypothetical protein